MHRLVAWARPQDEPLLRALLEHAPLELVAVGADHTAEATALAASLNVPRTDDLRIAIREHRPEVLWLAGAAAIDGWQRQAMHAGDLVIISSEPPATMAAPPAAANGEGPPICFAPLMRRSPGFLSAREALAEFGAPQCAHVHMQGCPGEGSLFARLFDAADLIEACLGVVETVDAVTAGGGPSAAQALPALRGWMSASLRFADRRRCAALTLGDGATSWQRRLTLLGEAGELVIDDDGFRWRTAGGAVDEHREQPSADGPGRLIALQIQRLLEQRDRAEPPADTTRLLALCEAMRLSARTGQNESPARILEILHRV